MSVSHTSPHAVFVPKPLPAGPLTRNAFVNHYGGKKSSCNRL